MKENKQSLRSKNWMAESLLRLMEKTPFKAISISNIVEQADVARLTFYRNFKSKEEIILFRGNQINQNIILKLEELELDEKEEVMKVIVSEIIEHKVFFKAVIKNDLDYLVVKMFRDEISNLFKVIFDDANEHQLSFYVGGFSAVVLDWFESDCSEDLCNILLELM